MPDNACDFTRMGEIQSRAVPREQEVCEKGGRNGSWKAAPIAGPNRPFEACLKVMLSAQPMNGLPVSIVACAGRPPLLTSFYDLTV